MMTDAAKLGDSEPRRWRGRTRRLIALLALVLVIGAGLFVHAALPDTALTDIAGDALYAIAAYVGLVFLAPRSRSITIGALALGWCAAVELFQLTGIPISIGEVFAPAMLLLGTVFDARDLLIYTIAVVVAFAVDVIVRTAGHSQARRAQSDARTHPPTRS